MKINRSVAMVRRRKHRANAYLMLFLIFIIALLLLQCKSPESKHVRNIAESSVNKSDSFEVIDPFVYRSISPGIILDTTKVEATRHHAGIFICKPIVDKKKFPYVGNWVDSVVQAYEEEFNEDTKEDTVEQYNGMDIGWSMEIVPACLYQDDNFISYALQTWAIPPGMPSWYEYHIMNFDIKKNKEITFNDYFIIETAADTAFWANIIGGATDQPVSDARRYLELY